MMLVLIAGVLPPSLVLSSRRYRRLGVGLDDVGDDDD
jgi:hypothetical protein